MDNKEERVSKLLSFDVNIEKEKKIIPKYLKMNLMIIFLW